jgi:hypothetical protein
MTEVVNRDLVQDAAARRSVLGLPPAPVGEAETALVQAVVRAVLDWAGLDEQEAEAPGYQIVLVPNKIGAELIGATVLAELKARGFAVAPSGHRG